MVYPDEHLIHSQRYPRLQDHSVDVNHPRGELHRVPRGPCFCRLQPRISAGCNHSSSHGICDGFSHPHYRGTSRIIKVVAGSVKIQWVIARSISPTNYHSSSLFCHRSYSAPLPVMRWVSTVATTLTCGNFGTTSTVSACVCVVEKVCVFQVFMFITHRNFLCTCIHPPPL